MPLRSQVLTGEREGHTLDTTALVHEAYFRIAGLRAVGNDRAHFYAIAAGAMRRVLVDHARQYRATNVARRRGASA